MKKLFLLSTFSIFLCLNNLPAQSITFPDDSNQRGYHSRPYLRYEAEPDKCETNGTFLSATYDQREVQSEASNQIAVQLSAKNDYVKWIIEDEADGLTLRFSLPDSEDGKGTKGTFSLYIDNEFVQDITADSYWAWQYVLKSGSKYPDNTPADNKFPRMRFDEMHWKLDRQIPAGTEFKIVKKDDNTDVYIIDFIELEKVPAPLTFESIADENKVEYTESAGILSAFIRDNGGKTIFLPPGRYEVDDRIYITADDTKLIGAGMWHTEIYFTASSDNRTTYSKRGIETNNSRVVVEGLYLNTVNNKRYYFHNDVNNSTYQVGKGFMGGFGSNSIIRNVWVEHFECGAWIANYSGKGAENLTVEHCRFRNNYADGINLCCGVKSGTVQHCSFRNNGDDDMASWSTGQICANNTFRYCTAENNWRASSLGFFGGKGNKAHHCVIIDPMEAGARVNSDFNGTGFGTGDSYNEFHDISMYKGGVASGEVGVGGDLWGNQQGAIHLSSSTKNYDVENFKIYNIDLYDSKNDAVFVGSGNQKFVNIFLKDIVINGTGRYGIYFNNPKGNIGHCNILFENTGSADMNTYPSGFSYEENCAMEPETSVNDISGINIKTYFDAGSLVISGFENTSIAVYDMLGRKNIQTPVLSDKISIAGLNSGIYFVRLNHVGYTTKVVVL